MSTSDDGGAVTITAFEPGSLDEEELARYHAFNVLLRAESNPEDPPESLEVFTRRQRFSPRDLDRWGWFATGVDGALVGVARASSHSSGENSHVLDVGVAVHPEWRRKGIGWRCFSLAVELAEAQGKALLMGWSVERVPAGAAFAQAAGATVGFEGHENRLVLAELDPALLHEWVESGEARAGADYRLIGFDNRCPDDLAEAVVDVLDVMADAPRENLQMGHRRMTVAELREWDQLNEETGTQGWWLFAQEKASGRLVGITNVWWSPEQPETVGQGDTGVSAEHRGRGLGKWLKAAMLERILRERPEVKDVRTGNADSNVPMLDINHRLGFKPYIAGNAWQVEVGQARERLSAR